jgi:hypothetical protein
MKKIFFAFLFLVLSLSGFSQTWTPVNGRYVYQYGQFTHVLGIPDSLPILANRVPWMIYAHTADSTIHVWTGFTDIALGAGSGTDSALSISQSSALTKSISGTNISLSSATNWQVVTNYGAVHDSATNDAGAIQAAINYITNTTKKGVVYLPAGIYHISATIHIPSGTQISFVGAGGSYGSPANSICKIVINSATLDALVDSANFAFISGVDFQNVNANPTAGAGVHIIGSYPDISQGSVQGFFDNLKLENSTYPNVSDMNFVDAVEYDINNTNILNPDNGDARITGCNFGAGGITPHNTVAGIYQNSSGGLKVIQGKWNAGGTFIQNCILSSMAYSTSDFLVSNCSFENYTGDAINLTLAPSVSFYNVNIHGNQISSYHGGNGIILNGSAGSSLSKSIINANIINNVDTAISLNTVLGISISGNQIDSPVSVSVGFHQIYCTNIYYDGYYKVFADSLQSFGRVTNAFLQPTASGLDTPVYDLFNRANTTDIAGSTPSPYGIGAWNYAYPSGFVTLGINSNQLYCPTSGTAFYYTNSINTVNSYDLSATLVNASTTSGGITFLIGNYVSNNTYLEYVVASSYSGVTAGSIIEVIGGTSTTIYTGSVTVANGDVMDLKVSNDTAYAMRNGTQLGFGIFNAAALTGTGVGVEYYLNTATVLDNFIQTTFLVAGYKWGVATDGTTITGLGTPASPLHTLGDSTGSYVPNFGTNTNVASIASDSAMWSVRGRMVTVYGSVQVTPTAATTVTTVNINTPFTSAWSGHNCWGSFTTGISGFGSGGGGNIIPNFSVPGQISLIYQSGVTTTAITINYNYRYFKE